MCWWINHWFVKWHLVCLHPHCCLPLLLFVCGKVGVMLTGPEANQPPRKQPGDPEAGRLWLGHLGFPGQRTECLRCHQVRFFIFFAPTRKSQGCGQNQKAERLTMPLPSYNVLSPSPIKFVFLDIQNTFVEIPQLSLQRLFVILQVLSVYRLPYLFEYKQALFFFVNSLSKTRG